MFHPDVAMYKAPIMLSLYTCRRVQCFGLSFDLCKETFVVNPQNVTAVVGTTNVRLHFEFSNSGIFPYWEVLDSGIWYIINNNDSSP